MNNNPNMQNLLMVPQGYSPGLTILNDQNPGIVNNPPAVGHQGYNTGFSTILNNQIPGNVINPPGIGHQGYNPGLSIINNHNIGAVNAPPGMTPGTVMINPNSPTGQNNPGMNVGTMMFKTGIPYGMNLSNQFK
jgi:hypothetical protein